MLWQSILLRERQGEEAQGGGETMWPGTGVVQPQVKTKTNKQKPPAGHPQKLEERRKDPLLETLEAAQSSQHIDFSSMQLISNFQPPELGENTFLLF